MRAPRTNPMTVLEESDREVTTAELWGGESFDEVFPTFTAEELETITERRNGNRLHAGD